MTPAIDRGTAREIAARVAEQFGLLPDDLLRNQHQRRHGSTSVVDAARRVLYYALRRRGWSLVRIGRACGGRDHTTVLIGLRYLEEHLSESAADRAVVEALCDRCGGVEHTPYVEALAVARERAREGEWRSCA